MMKIKQKKQVRLDELLKYVWDNEIKNTVFHCEKTKRRIRVDSIGDSCMYGLPYIYKDEYFTIEEEVEINEDMVLPIVFVYWNDTYEEFWTSNRRETSIKELLKIHDVKFIYLQNEDGSIGELIWKDGEFVD